MSSHEPQCGFQRKRDRPLPREDLQLTDLSVSSLNRITSRSWDFGDGTTSIALNPTHTYTTAGNYTVTLTISDPSGCIATATRNVQVHALPVLSVPVDSTICSGSTLRLNVSGAQQYDWAPAAGLSATSGANVDATPSVATTYTITGTDANGCSSSGTVNVGLAPVPNLQTSGDVAYLRRRQRATERQRRQRVRLVAGHRARRSDDRHATGQSAYDDRLYRQREHRLLHRHRHLDRHGRSRAGRERVGQRYPLSRSFPPR